MQVVAWISKLIGVSLFGLAVGTFAAFVLVGTVDSLGLINNLKGGRSARDELVLGALVLASLGLIGGTPLLFASIYAVKSAVSRGKRKSVHWTAGES